MRRSQPTAALIGPEETGYPNLRTDPFFCFFFPLGTLKGTGTYSRSRNSSRLKLACSKIASSVPRGMSFPFGFFFMNARWLPLPLSGASAKPAFRIARMIFCEESDGNRTRRRQSQGTRCSGIRNARLAERRPTGPVSWRWRGRAPLLLSARQLLFWESDRKMQPQLQDIWKRIGDLHSKSQRLSGSIPWPEYNTTVLPGQITWVAG